MTESPSPQPESDPENEPADSESQPNPGEPTRRPPFKRFDWILTVVTFAISLPVFFFFAKEKADRDNSGIYEESNEPIVFEYDQHPYLNAARKLRESNFEWPVPRHRMPGYSYLLAPLWDSDDAYPRDPDKVDPRAVSEEFFERGKLFNIWASILCLIITFVFVRRWLPTIESLIVTWGFGWFLALFKAPYVQPENLFYLFLLFSFVLLWRQLSRPTWLNGILGGASLAGAFILKSAVLPLILLFVVCFALKTFAQLLKALRERKAGGTPAANPWATFFKDTGKGTLVPAVFVTLLAPYLNTTWEEYGSPMWNVHSKYYMWMDHRDEKYKWRARGIASPGFVPPEGDEPPGAAKYWREHSVTDYVMRVYKGMNDLRGRVRRDYPAAYYFAKNVCIIMALAVCVICWRRAWPTIRSRWAESLLVVGFFSGYGALYFWYEKIGVGPRLLMALYLPFLFAFMAFVYRFSEREIKIPRTEKRINLRYLVNGILVAFILFQLYFVLSEDLWVVEGGR